MSPLRIIFKTILYVMFIFVISGTPLHPPGTLLRAGGHHHRVQIPLFMINLYQILMGKNKGEARPENQILEESDTVQSLKAKKFTVEDDRWSLTFNLSTISRNDELRMVELQVHLPPFTKSGNVTVDIYHVKSGENKLFLGSVTTNIPIQQNSSWASFNVTKMIVQSLLWGQKLTHHGEEKPVDMTGHKYSRKIEKRDVSHHEISTDQAIIVFFTKHKPFSKPDTPSIIKKLAVNTMKMAAFHGHKSPRSETQPDTPSNSHQNEDEERRTSPGQVDRAIAFKERFTKYKIHSSLRGPVLLY